MEKTIEFMYWRIQAMQQKIDKLEMTILEINMYNLVDQSVDLKKATI